LIEERSGLKKLQVIRSLVKTQNKHVFGTCFKGPISSCRLSTALVLLPSLYRRKSLDGFDWLEPDCQRASQGRRHPTQCSTVEPLSPMWVLHLRELTAIQADYTNPGLRVKHFETFPREIL